MWDIIQLALKLANVKMKASALKSLFQIDDYMEVEEEEVEECKGVFVQHVMEKNAQASRNRPLDLELMEKYSTKLADTFEQITENIKNKIKAPKECGNWEWMCRSARVTIYQDKWIENKETTQTRGPFLPFVDTLFVLEMYLRAWRRSDKIICSQTEFDQREPIYCTYHDFKNPSWFMVLIDDDSKEDAIIAWNPTKLIKQFNTLMRDRLADLVHLNSDESQKLFTRFLCALMDKAALCIYGQVAGLPEELSPFNPTYFKLYDTRLKITDPVNLNPSTHSQLSKKVQEARIADLEFQMKLLEVDDSDKPKVYTTTRERLEDIYIGHKDGELSKLKQLLNRLEQKRPLLAGGQMNFDDYDYEGIEIQQRMDEVDAADAAELKKVDEEIAAIKELLEEYKKKEDLDDAVNLDAGHQMLNETIKDSAKHSQTLGVMSVCGTEYTRALMTAADHVASWHCSTNMKISIYDIHHAELKEAFFQEISKAVMNGNEVGFMANANNWIVSRSVSFTEREEWRASYSADATFTTLDVLRGSRGDAAGKLKGFVNMQEILKDPEHVHHYSLLEYCVYWWVMQNLKQIGVYTTCYADDVEMSALAMDADPLRNHCMTKLGVNFYIMEPGSWLTPEGWLNAWFCGKNPMDCFAAWVRMVAAKDWIVYDRAEKKKFDIRTTRVKLIWDEVREKRIKLEEERKRILG